MGCYFHNGNSLYESNCVHFVFYAKGPELPGTKYTAWLTETHLMWFNNQTICISKSFKCELMCCAYSYVMCILICAVHTHMWYAYLYVMCILICAGHIHMWCAYSYVICILICDVHTHMCWAYSYVMCILICDMHTYMRVNPNTPSPVSEQCLLQHLTHIPVKSKGMNLDQCQHWTVQQLYRPLRPRSTHCPTQPVLQESTVQPSERLRGPPSCHLSTLWVTPGYTLTGNNGWQTSIS